MAPDHLVLAGGVIIVCGGIAAASVGNRRVARHLYWWSWCIGTPVISYAFTDRGWRVAAAALAVGFFAAVFVAYMRTPFLKIGGTIHAYTLVDSRPDPPAQAPPPPPDAYGGVITARKMWWTLAVFSVGVAFSALHGGASGTTLGAGAVLAVLLLAAGHLDRRDDFPVARGQLVPFALVFAASIPAYLLPVVAYGVTYYWLAAGTAHGRESEDVD